MACVLVVDDWFLLALYAELCKILANTSFSFFVPESKYLPLEFSGQIVSAQDARHVFEFNLECEEKITRQAQEALAGITQNSGGKVYDWDDYERLYDSVEEFFWLSLLRNLHMARLLLV